MENDKSCDFCFTCVAQYVHGYLQDHEQNVWLKNVESLTFRDIKTMHERLAIRIPQLTLCTKDAVRRIVEAVERQEYPVALKIRTAE